MDRRKFVHGVARGGLLAILAILSGILVTRNQIKLEEQCFDNFQCRNCGKLSSCGLPEAANTKENG